MNSLQTAPRNQIQNQPTDPLAALPTWLHYLTGAFPAAKVTSATFMVYEDQFSDAEPRMMLEAVRRAVRSHKFGSFPTIAELRQLVDGLIYDTAVAERPSVNLTATRHALFEAAYRDEIDPAEWLELYRQYITHKRLDGAFALKRQYERFTGEELAA